MRKSFSAFIQRVTEGWVIEAQGTCFSDQPRSHVQKDLTNPVTYYISFSISYLLEMISVFPFTEQLDIVLNVKYSLFPTHNFVAIVLDPQYT